MPVAEEVREAERVRELVALLREGAAVERCKEPLMASAFWRLDGLDGGTGCRRRSMVVPCKRCLGCYHAVRQREFRRLEAQAEDYRINVLGGITGEEWLAWLRDHARMITVTERSPEYRPVINMATGRKEAYSVAAFADRRAAYHKHLLDDLRRWSAPGGEGEGLTPAIYWQTEPQGVGADHRLHDHAFVLGVPRDRWVYDGPDPSREGAERRTLPEWLRYIRNEAPDGSLGRWLWKQGWGLSDCQRVTSLPGALEYVTRELSTADVSGGCPSPEELHHMFRDEVTGRRIQSFGVGGFFRGRRQALTRLGYYERVPLWEDVRVRGMLFDGEVALLRKEGAGAVSGEESLPAAEYEKARERFGREDWARWYCLDPALRDSLLARQRAIDRESAKLRSVVREEFHRRWRGVDRDKLSRQRICQAAGVWLKMQSLDRARKRLARDLCLVLGPSAYLARRREPWDVPPWHREAA
ncbi:MAG: hypothetical protein OXN90_02270 [Gemmatimonadota bacterium]|nr:hypothetical protein [Gemmatimonadota bacterium]